MSLEWIHENPPYLDGGKARIVDDRLLRRSVKPHRSSP